MPNAIDAEGAGNRFGDRLGLADLEYLGRAAVASQVVEGRSAGARVAAWLPKDHGMGALAEYAHAEGAHIVFLPEQLASHDELSALLKGLLKGLKTSTGVAPSDIEIRVVGSPASQRASSRNDLASASDGFIQPSVCRRRPLSSCATASRWA